MEGIISPDKRKRGYQFTWRSLRAAFGQPSGSLRGGFV